MTSTGKGKGTARDDGPLHDYLARRDLSASGEPGGGRSGDGPPVFVVQRHAASSLHFDVRLQVGDVLASWAVPKGPSLDPRQKRLASRTEDHPLDYADFEGSIPEGEYGAGQVIVWDAGTFENRTEDDGEEVPLQQALENGHVKVELHGEKLTGMFARGRLLRRRLGPCLSRAARRPDEGPAHAARGPARDPRAERDGVAAR